MSCMLLAYQDSASLKKNCAGGTLVRLISGFSQYELEMGSSLHAPLALEKL